METQKCESPPGFDSSWERLPDEEWLPVQIADGIYWVSNYSRVWVCPKEVGGANGSTRHLKGRVLSPAKDKKNHLYVGLRINGKAKYRYVHRLALSAFSGGERPYPEWEACHSDDDPTNNHIDNLFWGSRSDNTISMFDNGRHPRSNGKPCKWGHPRVPPNIVARDEGTRSQRCLACERARGYLGKKKPYTPEHFQKVSDSYYEQIMKENT